MTVGERIRQRRIELNMTQDELAKKAGYKSRSSINKIECSRDLPLSKVKRVATLLDCTPSYLMGWEENEKTIEMADIDSKLVLQEKRLKEYFLKIANMTDKQKEYIISTIDFVFKGGK